MGSFPTVGATPPRWSLRTLLRYDVPVIAWMAAILRASGDRYASAHTSRLLEPFLLWIAPTLSSGSVDSVVFVVRKLGHLTGYAILGALLFRALTRPKAGRRASGEAARVAFAVSLAWATVDEIRQAVSTVRSPAFGDIVLDATGAGLALIALCVAARARSGPAEAPMSGPGNLVRQERQHPDRFA